MIAKIIATVLEIVPTVAMIVKLIAIVNARQNEIDLKLAILKSSHPFLYGCEDFL